MSTSYEILSLVFAGGAILLIFFSTVITGDSPLPTSRIVKDSMLGILPEDLPKTSPYKIYELGSGWGGLARSLAKKYPENLVVGIEMSPLPWLFARTTLVFLPLGNLRFCLGNFYKIDFSECALAVCYLSPKTMKRLSLKFYEELPKESLILSNTFSLRGWQPIETVIAQDFYKSRIFLYQRPQTAERF